MFGSLENFFIFIMWKLLIDICVLLDRVMLMLWFISRFCLINVVLN